MIEFLMGVVATIAVIGVFIVILRLLQERATRIVEDQFRQVYTDNNEHPDIFHDLEPLEREQTAPETRVLEVLSDNKDAPITYQQLADLTEPLNENDVKNAVKSLESKGKVEVKSAGGKGSYIHVNEIQEVENEWAK